MPVFHISIVNERIYRSKDIEISFRTVLGVKSKISILIAVLGQKLKNCHLADYIGAIFSINGSNDFNQTFRYFVLNYGLKAANTVYLRKFVFSRYDIQYQKKVHFYFAYECVRNVSAVCFERDIGNVYLFVYMSKLTTQKKFVKRNFLYFTPLSSL